jgi:hypothetical protein
MMANARADEISAPYRLRQHLVYKPVDVFFAVGYVYVDVGGLVGFGGQDRYPHQAVAEEGDLVALGGADFHAEAAFTFAEELLHGLEYLLALEVGFYFVAQLFASSPMV